MGEEFQDDTPPHIQVNAIGTDTINTVSVLRNGTDTVYEVHPNHISVDLSFTDSAVEKGREYSYYIRVDQDDQHIAWTSPIWITLN